MVIVMTIAAGLAMMTDLGINQSIIRSPNAEKLRFRQTAWTFQIIRNCILTLIVLLITIGVWVLQGFSIIPSDIVYGDPNLVIALSMLTISTFIYGFASIDIFMAERQMKFGRTTFLELFTNILGILVTIIWAWLSPDIWALAGSQVIGTTLFVLFSHFIFWSPANKLAWEKSAAVELFNFGKWMMLSSLLGFLSRSGDRLILGLFLPTSTLGKYALAVEMVSALKSACGSLQAVWLPALSEANREQPTEIQRIYYKIRQYQDIFIFLLSGFVISAGDWIIYILYDERYQDAGWMLQILGVSIAFTAFDVKGTLLLVDGRSRQFFLLTLAGAVAMVLGIPIFFEVYGAVGAITMIAFVQVFGLPISFHFFHTKNWLNYNREMLFVPMLFIGMLFGHLIELGWNSIQPLDMVF